MGDGEAISLGERYGEPLGEEYGDPVGDMVGGSSNSFLLVSLM